MTLVCLAAGIVLGIATGQFVTTPQATATPVPLVPTETPPEAPETAAAMAASVTPGVQKSLLVLGVTDTSVPGSQLEAVWVVSFRPGVPTYYVTAFRPSAIFEVAGLAGPLSLSQIHAEDARLQLDHNFVRDAIQGRFPAWTIQADVTLDRGDLSALVGQLGGLPLNSQTLTGPMLLQTYDTWPVGNDMDRVNFQGVVIQQLFQLFAQRQWSAQQLVEFVTQIPRINGDPRTVEALRTFAQEAPPIQAESLVWHPIGPETEATTASSSTTP